MTDVAGFLVDEGCFECRRRLVLVVEGIIESAIVNANEQHLLCTLQAVNCSLSGALSDIQWLALSCLAVR